MNELEHQIVVEVEGRVQQRMGDQQAGHGMDHVRRVVRAARLIQAEVGGNRLIVELSAILHDVGDAKFHHGIERSAEFAREILSDFDVSQESVDHVAGIVDNISFRKGVDAASLSLEAKIVQDADRLDAMGAIGIVRTAEYGAAFNQPFYLPGESQKTSNTGIGHFYQKLFKLRGLMNTEPGKRMAADREAFMRHFVSQFLRESGNPETKIS